MRMSLRSRIFLWYALSIPILVLILTFVAQQVMITRLRLSIDERLRERTEVVSSAVLDSPGTSREDYEALIKHLTEQQLQFIPAVLRIADAGHNVLATFGDIPASMVPIMNRQLLLPELEEGRFETISVRDYDSLRLYTIGVHDPSSQELIAFVQTGDSLASLIAARQELWRYSLIVALGGSLLALLVGLFILRQGLRPLDRIIDQVHDIDSKDLKEGIAKEPRPPELQQLADNINGMLQRLDKAFKAREVFIAGVSHDLRTPLTVLQGQIEVMQMQLTVDAGTKESIDRMSREIRRLVRMTNNLLLSAQLEASPILTRGEVDLKELVEDVERDTRVLAEGLDFKVLAPEGVMISGDYDLLKPMLLNVVDNAIKFTPKGGNVGIRLYQEKGYAVLEVTDSGQGIPQESLAHVTEPFYKSAAPRSPRRTGAGLGLAIVKKIVTLHGGKLKIRSRKGAGTTVTIRLPCRR